MSNLFDDHKIFAYDCYSVLRQNPKEELQNSLKELEVNSKRIDILNSIAYCYYYLTEFYTALDYALRAYNCGLDNIPTEELYYTSSLLGHIYRYLGIYDAATRYYMAALNLTPQYQLKEKRCAILRYISITYTDMEMLDLATDYAIESLQLAELIHHSKLISDIQVTLSNIYLKSELYDKALKLCETSIVIYEVLDDKKGLTQTYLICGDIFNQTNNYDKSKHYYEKSLILALETKNTYNLVKANYALGRLLLGQGHHLRAKTSFEDALNLTKRYRIQHPKVNLYYALSEVFIIENNYEQAFNLYKLATELHHTLHSVQHRESIFKLHNSYALIQKDTQLRNTLEANETLEAINKQLLEQVQHDPLTQLLNRRGFKYLLLEYDFDGKHAITLCDIDNFKSINDTYGHQCGDYVLLELARFLRQQCLPSFKISRWGGEEFLILMPYTPLNIAADFSDQLRSTIESLTYTYRQHKITFTLTFGVAKLMESFEQSIEIVDKCLYFGKHSGRNQVIVDDSIFELTC